MGTKDLLEFRWLCQGFAKGSPMVCDGFTKGLPKMFRVFAEDLLKNY